MTSALIGATRPEQVEENVKAAGVKLFADVIAQIEAILAQTTRNRGGSMPAAFFLCCYCE